MQPLSGACLAVDDILLYHEGRLDPAREKGIRSHIAVCAACRELVAMTAEDEAPSAVAVVSVAPPTKREPKSDTATEVGDLFVGKYVVEGVLGEGGMGKVLAARHFELDRPVAIKIIHPDWVRDEDTSRRLVREARVVATLSSENIVRIFDLGRTPEGLPYIVMERLVGSDIGALLSRGPVAIDTAIDYALQVCAALDEAHARGVIHRDIKPQNLFLTTGTKGRQVIKVLDFGLAKDFARPPETGESKLTGVHMMLGSPHFMSPEQLRDARKVDARSDVWSVGATLYQIVTGQPPFLAPNLHVLCARILTEQPTPMSQRRQGVPAELERIVQRCLQREGDHRYPDVKALAEDLRHALEVVKAGAARAPVEIAATYPLQQHPYRRDSVDAVAATVVRPYSEPNLALVNAAARPSAPMLERASTPSQPVAHVRDVTSGVGPVPSVAAFDRRRWVLPVAGCAVLLLALGIAGALVWRRPAPPLETEPSIGIAAVPAEPVTVTAAPSAIVVASAEAKPAEAKPAEAKPAEVKPAEPKGKPKGPVQLPRVHPSSAPPASVTRPKQPFPANTAYETM